MTEQCSKEPLMLTIRCITYNHEPYIRQCLEGFVMQKTNFRFEAIVHDDASTDGTADIIREFADKYPGIIKPIFETENQYSKHDGSIRRIMDAHTHGKYVAICEGDDYWTDPLKLQKQVDFMEGHPDHSLCFHAHFREYADGRKELDARYDKNIEFCPVKDAILGGGGYMATNSMLFRKELGINNFPKWACEAPVGDLPLMLVLIERGYIGYLNFNMSTYRLNSIGSWTNLLSSINFKKSHIRKMKRVLKEFDEWSEYKFHKYVFRSNLKKDIYLIFCLLKSYLKF